MGTAPQPILTQFHQFAVECEIVGRLLTGYANLEVGLLHCVHMVLRDLDTPLKAMFKVRGESRRIKEAAKLGQAPYNALGLGNDFQRAVYGGTTIQGRWHLRILKMSPAESRGSMTCVNSSRIMLM